MADSHGKCRPSIPGNADRPRHCPPFLFFFNLKFFYGLIYRGIEKGNLIKSIHKFFLIMNCGDVFLKKINFKQFFG
jgi:hypothetical protein